VITPQDVSAARKRLGAQLAGLRHAAGHSQSALATKVTTSRSSVANIECGLQLGTRDFWQRCDDVRDADGALVRGYDQCCHLEARRRRQEAESAVAVPTVAETTPAHVDPELALHWLRMLTVLTGSHNLFGPRQIHDAVCRESAIIRRYREDAHGEIKTALFAVEARWAEFASWTGDNAGDRQGAAHWLERGLALARHAGDRGLVAYALMRQAQQAADRLDGRRAAALAGSAGSAAALTDRDRALCAVRQAQGHALAGDRTAAGTAIKTAYQLVARADEAAQDDDPATIGRHCVRGYVQAHEAYCELRLGHAASSALLMEATLGGWPSDYRQDESLFRAWLALAYAVDNRPDEAAAEGTRALTLACSSWSARTLRALAQLDTRLATHTGLAEASRFRTSYSLLAATRM
jgi:hypothetical protein